MRCGAGAVDAYFVDAIRDSAELIARFAWNPWRTRMNIVGDLWLLRARALQFDEPDIQRRLATGQQVHGTLPGELGEMPNIRLPPQFVELPQSK
ncbi:hypothetical protein BHQ19_28610 [Mycolicibacterium porcinum]|nr:hypothetical protein BHQ19_28610 [Mycolicibacterium porcinum]